MSSHCRCPASEIVLEDGEDKREVEVVCAKGAHGV